MAPPSLQGTLMSNDSRNLNASQKKALSKMIRDGLSEREQDVLLFGWERPTPKP